LYYSIFTNKENRDKVALAVKGGAGVQKSVFDDLITELNSKTNGHVGYESKKLTNEDGSNKFVFCFDNLPKTITEKKSQKTSLESQIKVAEKELEKLTKKKGEDNIENKKKINDKEKELQKKDKEISELAQAEVLNKQKKVNDLGVADANFAFTGDKNIIKACATKQLLLTIRWLENDGNENGEFKLGSNKTLLDKISAAQTDAAAWNTAVKRYFEGKGSDLQARIKKVKEEESTEGIGLEVIREAYEAMGETAIVEAIDKELKPEPPTSDLTKEKLTELFKFAVDETT